MFGGDEGDNVDGHGGGDNCSEQSSSHNLLVDKALPYPKKRASFLSLFLPSFLFPSSPSSTEFPNESLSHIRAIEKRKAEIAFVGIEMSVVVFLFGVPTIAKPDKFLKY